MEGVNVAAVVKIMIRLKLANTISNRTSSE
jgi:hypothetical protein